MPLGPGGALAIMHRILLGAPPRIVAAMVPAAVTSCGVVERRTVSWVAVRDPSLQKKKKKRCQGDVVERGGRAVWARLSPNGVLVSASARS